MKINLTRLGNAYAGGWNDKSGKAAKFTSQDSEYRVYQPEVTTNSDGTTTVHMKQDHIRGGATDDHSELTVIFDTNGIPASLYATFDVGGDGKIPGVVVDIATVLKYSVGAVTGLVVGIPAGTAAAAATVATGPGAVVAGVTAGVVAGGAAAGTATAVAGAILGVAGATYNFFGPRILSLTDDGGRLNFNAVISHNINKLCAAVDA